MVVVLTTNDWVTCSTGTLFILKSDKFFFSMGFSLLLALVSKQIMLIRSIACRPVPSVLSYLACSLVG